MEVTYVGHSCFRIKGKDVTIVIDPFDDRVGLKEPKFECDVLLLSHDHSDHATVGGISDYHLLINGPGEYETNNTFVYGFPTFHDGEQGAERGKNTIYLMEIDGFSVLHLGDLGHELSQETLEKISKVDILMIPVGGVYTIDAKTAVRVISSLEPGIVIPMHFQTENLKLSEKLDGVDKFLNEMGIENFKELDRLKVTKPTDIPDETEVVVLKHTN